MNPSGQRARAVYFSHGGGPLPLLGDPGHKAMVRFMRELPSRLPRPDAIIVFSAHWEEAEVTIQSGARPDLFFDYYGFPEEAYRIAYPAPGAPDLAARIAQLLADAGISSRTDPDRGFDHGHFIPLSLMYPEADIPSLQVSLIRGLSPLAHLELGRALAPLALENILIIGSGFSFHNMRAFDWSGKTAPDDRNDAFQDWLVETCSTIDEYPERERRLVEWTSAPGARYCHPREEHLLPLHVCAGFAGSKATMLFDDAILGKRAVAFGW